MKKLFILVGPSASGKTYTEEALILHHRFNRLVAMTSRDVRAGELNGIHYNYKTVAECNDVSDYAFKIEINPLWLYILPSSDLSKQLDNGEDDSIFVYSLINSEPAIDLINHMKIAHPDIEVKVVIFRIDEGQRMQLLSDRGDSESSICQRLAREEDLLKSSLNPDIVTTNIHESLGKILELV